MPTFIEITAVAVYAFAFFYLRYFLSKLQEEGKNAATKADIADITEKMEAVRLEYARSLEQVRAELGRRAEAFRLQFETELRAYERIWDTAIDLMRATQALRPFMDTAVSGPEEAAARRQERFDRWNQAYNTFTSIVEAKRPFYPATIYEQLNRIVSITHKEAVEYGVYETPSDDPEYWEKAKKNYDALIKTIGEVSDIMRARLESLHRA